MPALIRGFLVEGTNQYTHANIALHTIDLIYDELKIQPTNVIHQGAKNKLVEVDFSVGDEAISNARLELNKYFDDLESRNVYSKEEAIRVISEKTLEIQYGNCNELSYLFFELAKEYCVNTSIELMMTRNHMFVVIGRDKDSDLNRPTHWGDDCIIADPWAKRAMTPLAFQFYRLKSNQQVDPVYSFHLKGNFQLYSGLYPELEQSIEFKKNL